MGKWALITGASAGIGREFAGIFAAERFNLVLLARNGERLTELAKSLKAKHGVESRVLAKDLSEPHAPREVFETLKDIPISVLVNNAGFGWHGTFAESDLKNSLEMI